MPLFTVLIPTYNRATLIGQTVDSILAQEFQDFEIIIVDDGSKDATAEVLAKYGARIKVLRQENQGAPAALNNGLTAATGKYIAIQDSDDLMFPWALSTYQQIIAENAEPPFIVGKPMVFIGSDPPAAPPREALRLGKFENYQVSMLEKNGWRGSLGWRYWGCSSLVLRADALRAVGGFTPALRVAYDTDLVLRLSTAQGFVQVLSPATFAYRNHAHNISRDPLPIAKDMWLLLAREREGKYPGGAAGERSRARLICTFTRPISLGFLWRGTPAEGWRMFWTTLGWNLRLRRVRYLLAFGAIAVRERLRTLLGRRATPAAKP